MRRNPLVSCCLVLVFAACSESGPTAVPVTEGPAFSFTNGPAELPNVVRADGRWAIGIGDPASGLVVTAGFPDDPRERVICGGTERPEFHTFQDVGWFRDVFQSLMNDPETNLHVYAYVPGGLDFCTAEWIAQGTGTLLYTDNDAYFSGTRANAWTFRIRGEVEMVDGGAVHWLTAVQHFTVAPSGSLTSYVGRVQM